MTPTLKMLLLELRSHPQFPELIRAVQRQQIRPFRVTEAEKSETARARWIYDSGMLANHNQWLALLTGSATQPEESND